MIGIIVSLCLIVVIVTIVIYRAINEAEACELFYLFFLVIPLFTLSISVAIRESQPCKYERLLVTKAMTEAKLEAFYKAYPEYNPEYKTETEQ